MTWVSECWGSRQGYNTKKSAFWRVTRELVHRLGIADVGKKDWPSHIAWSNLYKVSPDKGGNPTEALKEAQFPYCAKILAAEIRELKPRRVVFLTGWQWAKRFLGELGVNSSISCAGGLLEASGRLPSGSDFVVLPHPQGKPQKEIVKLLVTEDRHGLILAATNKQYETLAKLIKRKFTAEAQRTPRRMLSED